MGAFEQGLGLRIALLRPTAWTSVSSPMATSLPLAGVAVLSAAGRWSDSFEGLKPSGPDRPNEGLVVAFVLVRVPLGEVRDRAVELLAGAQEGRDRHRVSRPGVRPGERHAQSFAYSLSDRGDIASTVADPFMSRSCRQ